MIGSSVVAPYTGARIETSIASASSASMRVAPYTGARIETREARSRTNSPRTSPPTRGRGLKLHLCADVADPCLQSPPTRGRGLKQPEVSRVGRLDGVAPYTGARIETPATPCSRGGSLRSPPTRGRGLKRLAVLDLRPRAVAPYTGARIETPPRKRWASTWRVAPYTGARIETPWARRTTPG